MSIKKPRDKASNKTTHGQEDKLPGLATGFDELDRLLNGLHSGDLIVISSETMMGKSMFCQNIANNVAKNNIPVAIFSLEMRKEDLQKRLLSSETELELSNRWGINIDRGLWPKVAAAKKRLDSTPLIIDDSPEVNITKLCEKARKLKDEQGIQLLIIDKCQLICAVAHNIVYVERFAQIIQGLKALAVELNIAIVAVSGLNRIPEREFKDHYRPGLCDLPDSDVIEQNADVVLFIYRREVELENAHRRVSDDIKGAAEIIVAKNQHGSLGTIHLLFIGKYASFRNPERENDEV